MLYSAERGDVVDSKSGGFLSADPAGRPDACETGKPTIVLDEAQSGPGSTVYRYDIATYFETRKRPSPAIARFIESLVKEL